VQRSSTPKLLQWLWFSMRNSECSNFLFFRNLKFQWVESYSSFTLSASVVNAQQELKRCPKVTTNSEKGDYKKRGRTICERALRLQALLALDRNVRVLSPIEMSVYRRKPFAGKTLRVSGK
jgi:hypothetical protein